MRQVQRRRLEFATLVSIPLIWWVLVLLIPYLIMLLISFYKAQFPSHIAAFEFDSYLRVFLQPQYVSVLLRSLKIAMMVSIVTFLLAYPSLIF